MSQLHYVAIFEGHCIAVRCSFAIPLSLSALPPFHALIYALGRCSDYAGSAAIGLAYLECMTKAPNRIEKPSQIDNKTLQYHY